MKIKISLVMVLLVMLLGVSIVYGASLAEMPISDGTQIVVSLVNQDPDPAEPGNYVDIRFKFENTGGDDAHDITVELLPEYPFSLDPGRSAIQEVGSLYSRQKGSDGIIVKYHVKVDKDAVDGTSEIKLQYRVGNSNAWVIIDDFEIDIQTHELILAVKDIISEPKQIAPGEIGSVDILLENIANSLIKDIRVKLDIIGKPFTPIGSDNEKSLLYLESGKNAILNFNLMAEGDSEADVYQIPLLMSYVDEAGTKYTRNNTIGLVIGSAPDLSIIIDSTTIYTKGATGEVTVKFVNKGATDVKFLNVKLDESDEYVIKSNEEVYVGNIDSDDYETADFDLSVNSKTEGDVELLLSLEYKDANNREYSKKINLPLKLYSGSEAKKLGLEERSNFVGVFVVIVIVGAGLFLYIRKRRKKKKD